MSKKSLFAKLFNEYRELIERQLSGSGKLPDKIFMDTRSYDFMSRYVNIFNSHMDGGKRLRAFLVILGYNLSGNNYADEDILTASLSYELFQNGILMHDDIIDQSELRRNKPSVYAQFGTPIAICLGDTGIVAAYDAILLSGFSDDRKLKALMNQSKIFKLTVTGQFKDIELSDKHGCTLDEIITMYELKTAYYTFIGPLQLGIILGGGSDDLLREARELGRLVGIAFQIKDDIIGIYGKTEITGKSTVSDIEEGKNTVLTSYFRENASPYMLNEFNALYGKKNCPVTEADCARIRDLLDESNAHAMTLALYAKYINEALKVLDNMNISDYHKDILHGMIEYLNNRES